MKGSLRISLGKKKRSPNFLLAFDSPPPSPANHENKVLITQDSGSCFSKANLTISLQLKFKFRNIMESKKHQMKSVFLH